MTPRYEAIWFLWSLVFGFGVVFLIHHINKRRQRRRLDVWREILKPTILPPMGPTWRRDRYVDRIIELLGIYLSGSQRVHWGDNGRDDRPQTYRRIKNNLDAIYRTDTGHWLGFMDY